MKIIYKLLIIAFIPFVSCKEPDKVAPKPAEPIADSQYYYNSELIINPTAISSDAEGNCVVIGNGYVYKLNAIGEIVNSLTLIPGSWNKDYAFTPKGNFYSSVLSTSQPRKEKLVFYEVSPYQSFYFSPLVVDIKQTRMQNPNDEVWYWFGNNYPGHLDNIFTAFSTLQTATKFVKSALTGQVDTLSVLLNIEYPFDVTNEQEIILPYFKRKAINYLVYATDRYVLVTENNNSSYYYRYDSKLNLIDSFQLGSNPVLNVAENQFLYRGRGYFLSIDGTDKGVKIEQLEETDRIINVDGPYIYGLSNTNEIFRVDLKTNIRTKIINRSDKRFNNQSIGINYVWTNNKGKYFLFSTNGLYVF